MAQSYLGILFAINPTPRRDRSPWAQLDDPVNVTRIVGVNSPSSINGVFSSYRMPLLAPTRRFFSQLRCWLFT
jgi:hypothetical protein